MKDRIDLSQARAFYDALDPAQKHLMDNEFSDALKSMLRDDMTQAELSDAADAAFIRAALAMRGDAGAAGN